MAKDAGASLSSHKRASVRALIEATGARLKAMLRRAGERTVSSLWFFIGKLVNLFRPHECANYFNSCGYDPD